MCICLYKILRVDFWATLFLWRFSLVLKHFSESEQLFLSAFTTGIEALNLAIYDLEFQPRGNSILRLYIINPETNTATIDECVKVDSIVTPIIDEMDWVKEGMTLEVSSPGIYRDLSQKDHFKMAEGKGISLLLMKKVEHEEAPKTLKNQKRFDAVLESCSADAIQVNHNDFVFEVKFTDIKKASLNPDFSA